MSRSHRKLHDGRIFFTPITTAKSEKGDKKEEHSKERAIAREALGRMEEPDPRPRGQWWSKDGRIMWNTFEDYFWIKDIRRLLRK